MLFSIQTYLEEYISKRNMIDSDGYAIKLANLYFYYRSKITDEQFLSKVAHIRTVLFLNNGVTHRKEFEHTLIRRLDNKYKKKLTNNNQDFPGGTQLESVKLQQLPKLTIENVLEEFCDAVEARGIDAFWESRVQGRLRRKPEKIGQALFSLFTKGAIINRPGIVLREFQSGIGFVDVGIIFASTLHLIEIKVINSNFTGLNQLEQYMKTEKRKEGSLLIFDSRKPDSKVDIPKIIRTSSGIVKTYKVDINPIPPSGLN
jgi:hypothetical protein